MGINFEIAYHESVVEEDIKTLSKTDRIKIKKAIENKIAVFPEMFGKPLRRTLRGYRSLRVGDYRIVFRVEDKIVKIFYIDHRSVIYKNTSKRI